MIQGRDSLYDTAACAAVPSVKITSSNPALSQAVIDTFQEHVRRRGIQIPRFSRLTKEACKSADNMSGRIEALELATELYNDDLEAMIQDLLAGGLIVTVVPAPEYRHFLDKRFDFASKLLCAGLLSYWSMRVIVCGFLQILCRLPDAVVALDLLCSLHDVEEQDIKSATSIFMCTEYTHDQSNIPINAIRQIMPLKTAFGAWHRLEARAGALHSTNADAVFAREMKRCCVKQTSDIGSLWGAGAGLTEEVFLRRYQVMMGRFG